MRIVIEGRDLPGRTFAAYADVHVALQVGSEPVGAVPGDASSARWETEVQAVDGDLRGPAVHGRRGERFLYLTWGAPTSEGWDMFRRAKLMLADAPVVADGTVVATVSLTDEQGGPRCARVRPPAIEWRARP
ncbi:hypothetical protein GON03_06065 [Nocardioides sp. MAH-18]|uniref:Monooxygenase n=1 Tax=Nocardioides agri TaxID=2682843 RepID=A0A6L6XNQ3_9ACTN|nr:MULTISPECIES: DUF5990 family protein [unclassified Nocardioides]MBA2953878.1 hypothetical protein [Nocardioides sp. CGMCC 1.13656]MVQ48740.1 hypothetical protein [Nocardioides sp. MAH-18]